MLYLVYGSDAGWAYSDARGFEPSIGPWLWFKLYWMGWALLLALAARLLWVRGADYGFRQRLRSARRRLTRSGVAVAAGTAGLVVVAGGFVFYNTNVLNDYRTTWEAAAHRAEYERRYGQYEGAAQPQVTGTELYVEIYPERRAVEIRGTYHLVNRSAAAIDSVHLAPATSNAVTGAVALDQPSERVLADDTFGHQIYALERPLRPGDSLRLHFAVRFAPRGFSNSASDASVVANGTFFTPGAWLPAIGYQADRELSSPGERRAHGLAPRPPMRALGDEEARHDVGGRERVTVEAVIGTGAGQVAVAPGALQKTWAEDGRRYFHYATDAPMRNGYPVFSADYTVHETRWRGVEIQIFYHPDRAWNVERMAEGARAALEHFAERFGPYPHRQLKLVASPRTGYGATAYPGLIAYREGFATFRPEEDGRDLDFPFAVVAHEVAHQWWGHQLVPAPVEGAALLSESLAWYSALGVVEEHHGPEHLQRLLGVMREAYLTPRSRAGIPLLQAHDWFTAYRKGPFAMYALRAYVGEERIDTALRRLLEKHGAGTPPLPTSRDLYQELQAVTPDSLESLLADLFERNTFWELEAEEARAEPMSDGRWQVMLDIEARKVTVDSAGVETEQPMDDWVGVGIFADGAPGEPLYLHSHRIGPGEQTITVTTPRKPARAGIDPRHLLIDVDGRDNTTEVRLADESDLPGGRR